MDSSAWFPVFSVNTAHHCWLCPRLELFSAVRLFVRSLANRLSLQDHCIWRRQPMVTLCTIHSCCYYKKHPWRVTVILLCILSGFEPFKFSSRDYLIFCMWFPCILPAFLSIFINLYSTVFSNQINILVPSFSCLDRQHGQDKQWILRAHIIVLKNQKTHRLIDLQSSFLTSPRTDSAKHLEFEVEKSRELGSKT